MGRGSFLDADDIEDFGGNDEDAESGLSVEEPPENLDEEDEEDEEPESPARDPRAYVTRNAPPSGIRRAPPRQSRRIRTRPMPGKLRQRWPDVTTMLITNRDGSQILFIA